MKRLLWIVLILGLGGCATSPSLAPRNPDSSEESIGTADLRELPEVLAVVGGTTITLEDLEREMDERGGKARYPNRERREALLKDLIQFRVMLFRALDEGYDQREDVVASFEKILVGLYRREHLEEEIEAETAVSSEAIENYYRDHTDRFKRPERSRLALIHVGISPLLGEEGREQAKRKAEQVLAEAQKLGDDIQGFGPLAKRFSDDAATKYVGGIVGWLYPLRASSYKWPLEVLEPALRLEQEGDLSKVLESPDGFYLWRLVEREEATPVPLERVRDGIAGILRKERRSKRKEEFFQELFDDSEVWVDFDRLESLPELEVPTENQKQAPPPLPGRP